MSGSIRRAATASYSKLRARVPGCRRQTSEALSRRRESSQLRTPLIIRARMRHTRTRRLTYKNIPDKPVSWRAARLCSRAAKRSGDGNVGRLSFTRTFGAFQISRYRYRNPWLLSPTTRAPTAACVPACAPRAPVANKRACTLIIKSSLPVVPPPQKTTSLSARKRCDGIAPNKRAINNGLTSTTPWCEQR